MKNILLLLFVITTGCVLHAKDKQKVKIENFTDFYLKFYNDTVFQKERIVIPLQGTIKYWDDDVIKEESWNNKVITVTSKERFLQEYKNLKNGFIQERYRCC